MSGNKCCGNCKHFTNEDVNGYGWCSSLLARTRCGSGMCGEYEEPNNGWTEITPDNVEEVREVDVCRLMIAVIIDGEAFYMEYRYMFMELNEMAKLGGYYYYILPELKIE